jgi:hypothetical protein
MTVELNAGRSWLVLITSRQLGPEELPTMRKAKSWSAQQRAPLRIRRYVRKSWHTRYVGNSILYC